jgi:hypothetical protein
MSIFHLPRAYGFDSNGDPISGARLYFYAAGTSTPKDTYSDSALTTANSNPVVANSAGLFGPIFLAEGGYKVVLTNAAEVELWSQDDVSAFDASGVTYNQGATGAVTRSVLSKLQDTVSVTDFGAVGDATTDDTVAIQAAINSGARRVIAPSGRTFRITDTLVINRPYRFQLDFGMSSLRMDDPSGTKDHILIGDDVTQRFFFLRNISFNRVQAATSGYAINCQYVGVSEISNCRIFGNNTIYNGIRIWRGIIVNIFNNYIDNVVNRGIYLEGQGSGGNRTVDISIRENRIDGGVNALYTWDWVEGIFVRDNIFYNQSGNCVNLDASNNTNGRFSVKIQENDLDTSGGIGLYVDKINNIQVTGNWISNNDGNCIELGPEVSGCQINANMMYPKANGVAIDGADVRLTGNLILGGLTSVVINSAATRPSVVGNTLGNSQYAVNINNANGVLVANNYLQGLSLGGFQNTTGTGNTIIGNQGDSTAGTPAAITVTTSPFTYTCGPRPEFVSIHGGTVSGITIGGLTVATATGRGFMLAPGQAIVVTYSSAPTMVRNRL